jgi:beta-glucosidase
MVIPSGTAIQNARTTLLKDKVTRDGYHLHKTYGRYVAACTWYEKIFRKNVVGNTYKPENMTAEEQLAAQKSAHAAVKMPHKVTIIKHKKF